MAKKKTNKGSGHRTGEVRVRIPYTAFSAVGLIMLAVGYFGMKSQPMARQIVCGAAFLITGLGELLQYIMTRRNDPANPKGSMAMAVILLGLGAFEIIAALING